MNQPGRHWPEYLIEAVSLALFMVSAAGFATLLQHPSSPLAAWQAGAATRRMLMGAAMGATAAALVYSPLGKRSGGHLNPAITLSYWRLGKIARADAVGYVTAHFAGGVIGIVAATWLLRGLPAHPSVNYVATVPGPWGVAPAFGAELTISFVMMTTVLIVSNSRRFAPLTGLSAGVVVALCIALESPLSGTSMNPARTLGSNLLARSVDGLWIYFLAPPLGMLAATELYMWHRSAVGVRCAKLHHALDVRCIFRCGHQMAAPTEAR
jgi:aquaporin Z